MSKQLKIEDAIKELKEFKTSENRYLEPEDIKQIDKNIANLELELSYEVDTVS